MKLQQFFPSFLILFISFLSLQAQNHYNIRLDIIDNANPLLSCYDVQLASADAVNLNLAGQNYRLYYDAMRLKYKEESSFSLLPAEQYTDLILKDDVQDINAASVGKLAFDDHLSFINIGNDLKEEKEGGIILPASGEWISTARVCFEKLNNTSTNTNTKNSIYWARPELTAGYATSFVEVAEWLAPFSTTPAKAAIYFDEEASTSSLDQQWEYLPKIYPNPTSEYLFIEHNQNEELLIQLYTIDGKLLINDRTVPSKQRRELQLGQYPTGMYQLRISGSNNKMLLRKIEIIH